uniref:Uncharacterized protein n=1 Tax=Oryza rufipogon TaxID=4529 RepID=A0A0E0P3M1_ORYRU
MDMDPSLLACFVDLILKSRASTAGLAQLALLLDEIAACKCDGLAQLICHVTRTAGPTDHQCARQSGGERELFPFQNTALQ